MKLIFTIIFTCLFSNSFSQKNLALKLDGLDNKLSIGMDTLKNVWTVEAWIKGDNNPWRELEAVIAGGEYGKQNISDHLSLVIKNGRLYNAGANIYSPNILPYNEWIHVAATSNKNHTALYINGVEVAKKDTSISILPGAIGVDEDSTSVFGGYIDEVRIWGASLTPELVKEWNSKPIMPTHPTFEKLKGYYTFDNWSADMSVNPVGKGHQSYHIRNGRVKQYGNTLLAYAVPNNNKLFTDYIGNQTLFNATIIANEWDSDQGEKEEQIVKIRVVVKGSKNPLELENIELDLSKCTSLMDIDCLNLYYTGSKPRSNIREKLCKNQVQLKNKISLKLKNKIKLKAGVNYFLLTADIAKKATVGNRIKITIPTLSLSGKKITPIKDTHSLDKFVSSNSTVDNSVFKVLQWNIWHGGIHVGKFGRSRVIELIQHSNADIVMMQEAYGAQQRIANSLNFQMISASHKDNLALFSRFPLQQIKTKNPFFSIPAYVTFPNKKRILLNNCWFRYAYRPEYTCVYGEQGLDTDVWCQEDSLLTLTDVKRNIKEDIQPYKKEKMDVIIGGDFNSCSHLDWTKRASHLHYGYTADRLPVSRYMIKQGYTDTFRSIHTNEVERPEGTYAVIFGHRQTARIDFIYYKGNGIRPIFSKIVRTAAEIDDVWASDHAAVLTTFSFK